MIRSTGSNENDDGTDLLGLLHPTQDQIDTEWEQFCQRHIDPTRLFKLSYGMIEATEADVGHLEWCKSCRSAYEQYVDPDGEGTAFDCGDDGELLGPMQNMLREAGASLQHDYNEKADDSTGFAPDELRHHFQVDGPVVFPGKQVAFESWQFGRLARIHRRDRDLAEDLVRVITTKAKTYLLHRFDHRNLMLVCFGRPMHHCGTRLAADLVDTGFDSPHVVLAHDYYSPTLICDPKEFRDTDVLVLVDVVHTGGMLHRLMETCRSYHPRRVRGLALIDQSQKCGREDGLHALWSEPLESRISLSEFLKTASPGQKAALRHFEPNDCLADSQDANQIESSTVESPSHIELELAEHIHATGAIKRDHRIGHCQYSYVVNVLDLLRKDDQSRQFVLNRAADRLADVAVEGTCLAYHVSRAARAGTIAKILGERLGWPTMTIGTRGPTSVLTNRQYRSLARYKTVVLVDAAIRTGDSISALAMTIKDKWIRQRTKFLALCVLDAMSKGSRSDLEVETGMEIRTLFRLPMAPPSAEVRHWAKAQKSLIREKVAESGDFVRIEQALGNYLAPPKRGGGPGNSVRSLEQTRKMLETVVSCASNSNQSVARISNACRELKANAIQRLTVDEIIHDERVQHLLIGVMYNSMSPSFKESAAYGLAAAGNYSWMELEWLKCNRAFLESRSNAWKSIPLIQCDMKLANRDAELAKFRNAAIEFRDQCLTKKSDRGVELQLQLPMSGAESRAESKKRKGARESHFLEERLNVIIEATS